MVGSGVVHWSRLETVHRDVVQPCTKVNGVELGGPADHPVRTIIRVCEGWLVLVSMDEDLGAVVESSWLVGVGGAMSNDWLRAKASHCSTE